MCMNAKLEPSKFTWVSSRAGRRLPVQMRQTWHHTWLVHMAPVISGSLRQSTYPDTCTCPHCTHPATEAKLEECPKPLLQSSVLPKGTQGVQHRKEEESGRVRGTQNIAGRDIHCEVPGHGWRDCKNCKECNTGGAYIESFDESTLVAPLQAIHLPSTSLQAQIKNKDQMTTQGVRFSLETHLGFHEWRCQFKWYSLSSNKHRNWSSGRMAREAGHCVDRIRIQMDWRINW